MIRAQSSKISQDSEHPLPAMPSLATRVDRVLRSPSFRNYRGGGRNQARRYECLGCDVSAAFTPCLDERSQTLLMLYENRSARTGVGRRIRCVCELFVWCTGRNGRPAAGTINRAGAGVLFGDLRSPNSTSCGGKAFGSGPRLILPNYRPSTGRTKRRIAFCDGSLNRSHRVFRSAVPASRYKGKKEFKRNKSILAVRQNTLAKGGL